MEPVADSTLPSSTTCPDCSGSKPAIAAAMARGIPTVLVDRGLKAMGYDTCLVSADDRLIGDITAAWLAEATGGRGRVLLGVADHRLQPAGAGHGVVVQKDEVFPGRQRGAGVAGAGKPGADLVPDRADLVAVGGQQFRREPPPLELQVLELLRVHEPAGAIVPEHLLRSSAHAPGAWGARYTPRFP